MDYNKELSKIEQTTEYFNPTKEDQYKITFETELSDPVTGFSKGLNKEVSESECQITCNGQKYLWTITTGGKISLYGQLVKLAVHWNGLKGKTCTLLLQRDGGKRKFTILESIAIKPGIQMEKNVIQ